MIFAVFPLRSDLKAASKSERGNVLIRVFLGSFGGRVGAVVAIAILLLALVGQFLAPYSPTAIVGAPFQGPSAQHWLGTDVLGRDGLSRYLSGGRTLVRVALAATTLAYLCGIAVGLVAGFRRGLVDIISVVTIDLILAIPPIIMVLVLLAAVGPRPWLVIVAIGGVFTPRIARLVRSVALEVSAQDFVEAAVASLDISHHQDIRARGERMLSILYWDVLMNALLPISADVGIRLAGAIILFSSLSYLGLGEPPPTPDWGAMISENRAGVTIQPWVVVVPAATIALLAVGVNLIADTVARATGRSVVARDF
jgi:peptide/nickel transport system permease protein